MNPLSLDDTIIGLVVRDMAILLTISSEDLADDPGRFDSGEALVEALELEAEPLVIHA
jgi:hypothetical protein